MLLLLMLAVTDPSAPPLVPLDEAPSPDEELNAVNVTAAPAEDAPVQASRTKRMAGTAVGALLGDGIAVGAWVAQMFILAGVCGLSCLGSPVGYLVTGIGSALGLMPLGAFIGNRLAGGQVPYWKMLLGTTGGAVLAGVFVALFEAVGLFRSTGGSVIGVAVAGMTVMTGQLFAAELGVTDP